MTQSDSTPYIMTTDEIDGSFELFQQAFRSVRPFILSHAGKVDHTDKQDGSPVTDADVEAENTIKAILAKKYPNVPVYGEEGGYSSDLAGAFWLLDPIDGTHSFIDNVPMFTSMAVLISSGQAVSSIIYNISTDDMYIARVRQGAYKNGQRLDLRAMPLPNTAWCKELFIPQINPLIAAHNVACKPAAGGGGYGFTLVAEGQLAARFNLHSGGYTHDYAPGALLVREAGGALVPVLDDTYTYETRSFVACHPALESTLIAHREELRALERTPKQK